MLEECINILHSLRMLSLHVVKCIIDWRKQLLYSYLMANQVNQGALSPDSQARKFKSIPFIWEGENYLLKMKNDTHFLNDSEYGKHFNFSTKSDPFLVFPSSKHNAVGGGAAAITKLKGQGIAKVQKREEKLVIPLPNSLMKMIRQSEVYLMEEAVTEQIMKQSHNS